MTDLRRYLAISDPLRLDAGVDTRERRHPGVPRRLREGPARDGARASSAKHASSSCSAAATVALRWFDATALSGKARSSRRSRASCWVRRTGRPRPLRRHRLGRRRDAREEARRQVAPHRSGPAHLQVRDGRSAAGHRASARQGRREDARDRRHVRRRCTGGKRDALAPRCRARARGQAGAAAERGHTVFPWIVVGLGAATMAAGIVVILTSPSLPSGCSSDTKTCTRLGQRECERLREAPGRRGTLGVAADRRHDHRRHRPRRRQPQACSGTSSSPPDPSAAGALRFTPWAAPGSAGGALGASF